MTFVHLHAHTHYSFLDALAKPKDYANMCKKYEMPACAITDHGGLYGAVEFYQKMEAAGVKPIIGMDAYIASGGYTDKSPENKRYRMVLIAMNNKGFTNLMKLASIGHLEGFYYNHVLMTLFSKNILRGYLRSLVTCGVKLDQKFLTMIMLVQKMQLSGIRKFLEKRIFILNCSIDQKCRIILLLKRMY